MMGSLRGACLVFLPLFLHGFLVAGDGTGGWFKVILIVRLSGSTLLGLFPEQALGFEPYFIVVTLWAAPVVPDFLRLPGDFIVSGCIIHNGEGFHDFPDQDVRRMVPGIF